MSLAWFELKIVVDVCCYCSRSRVVRDSLICLMRSVC